MEHFIMAKQSDGKPIWINVDQVRYVVSTADRAIVYFEADHAIEIADQSAVVVDSSRKAREKPPT